MADERFETRMVMMEDEGAVVVRSTAGETAVLKHNITCFVYKRADMYQSKSKRERVRESFGPVHKEKDCPSIPTASEFVSIWDPIELATGEQKPRINPIIGASVYFNPSLPIIWLLG